MGLKNNDFKEFEIHPDMPKYFPNSHACDYKKVHIKRDTVISVLADNEDPDGFLIDTTCGKLHVKANKQELLDWLKRGPTAKDQIAQDLKEKQNGTPNSKDQ